MSQKLYDESNIQDIADAIREQNGTQNSYTVAQMGNAVRAIETQPDLETLNATENGNYLPSAGKDGFSSVHVEVQSPSPILEPLNADHNGDYAPSAGKDGFSSVHVAVQSEINLSAFKTNLWIISNGKLRNTGSSSPIIPLNQNGNELTIDTTKSHRLGVSINPQVYTNFAIFRDINASSNRYGDTPGIEIQSSKGIGFGVPGGGATWLNWISLGEYLLNQWYYLEYSYDATTNLVTAKKTTDFVNWESQSIEATPYGKLTATIAIGGWSGHNSATQIIDLNNLFIESEGVIVWGHHTDSFPTS